MTQTRVLHVSDTHLGKRQFDSDRRRDDFANAFDQAIAVAVDRDVDAVIHTGDLFDDSRPTLPTVLGCANTLDPLGEHGIPVYGIVGAHDRCDGDQWLDLFRRTNGVTRLGREPSVVGNTALYGIDAVRPGDWQTTDFTLEPPPAEVDCTILCMHERLEPPVDERTADYAVEDVRDRVNIDLDGLALGGYHEPTSASIDGTDVWYAGSTERSGTDEPEPGVVQLLEIDGADVARRQIELETRPFESRTITFGRGDGLARVRDVFDRQDLTDAAATIELVDDGGVVTTDRVTQLARDAGAAVVDVDDQRDDVGCAAHARDDQPRWTARNAVETAALRGLRRRAGRETAPAARDGSRTGTDDGTETNDGTGVNDGTGTDDGTTEPERAVDVPDDLADEYEALIGVRDRLDARMSEREAAIDELQTEVDALEADLATAVTDRGTAAAAFLPADRPPRSVNTGTRDAVASHVEALAETLDVRSAKLARTNAAIEVEQQNAANARDDIEETGAVVDRLEERTDEFESAVDDAREELAELRADSSDPEPDVVADAAGRVEDLEGDFADLQADLEEERAELADVTKARDEAEAAIATLETERAAIEAEIDELEATIDEGESSMAAFGVVDELRGLLEARTGELSGLREEYAELQTEREALDAEIEGLTDDE